MREPFTEIHKVGPPCAYVYSAAFPSLSEKNPKCMWEPGRPQLRHRHVCAMRQPKDINSVTLDPQISYWRLSSLVCNVWLVMGDWQ